MDTENPELKTTASGCRKSGRKHLFWIIPAAAAVLLAGGWFGMTCAVESTARRCLADASLHLIGQEVEPDDLAFPAAARYIKGALE